MSQLSSCGSDSYQFALPACRVRSILLKGPSYQTSMFHGGRRRRPGRLVWVQQVELHSQQVERLFLLVEVQQLLLSVEQLLEQLGHLCLSLQRLGEQLEHLYLHLSAERLEQLQHDVLLLERLQHLFLAVEQLQHLFLSVEGLGEQLEHLYLYLSVC